MKPLPPSSWLGSYMPPKPRQAFTTFAHDFDSYWTDPPDGDVVLRIAD